MQHLTAFGSCTDCQSLALGASSKGEGGEGEGGGGGVCGCDTNMSLAELNTAAFGNLETWRAMLTFNGAEAGVDGGGGGGRG